MPAPLPDLDGVSPSYLWVPEGVWPALLPFLLLQFPDIGQATWQRRLADGQVVDQHARRLQADSPVRRGMCIFYYREVEQETPIPFEAQILYQDQHILVADKPHFLPVTPSGRFLRETLLIRLKQASGLTDLTPLHRLDRETAGVVLFSLNPASRGRYQAMFQHKTMQKTYHALAPALADLTFPLIHRSRMENAEHFLQMREVAGPPNSETRIAILEARGENNLYLLQPLTGKKHQLRLHLSSLGAPIINDSFYPLVLPDRGDDFSAPLQLLAKSLSFTDPLSGELRQFHSSRSL